MSSWPAKDPDAVKDYVYVIPLDAGDSVADHTFEKLSGDVVIDSESRSGTDVTAWLSGGTADTVSVFRVAWETTAGREDDEIITLAVVENAAFAALEPYANPTAAMLKAAFPRFADVPSATVELWLTQARRSVDESWTEGDYAMGQMLLAAHYMTLQGLGTGVEATVAAQGMGDFKSVKSGSFSLDRGDSGATAASGSLGSTSYGRQFAALAKLNVGGPLVAPTGTLPTERLYPGSA